MDYILVSLLAPVPVFHLWLHALLSFWHRRPLLFYFCAAVLWVGAFLGFSYVEAAFMILLFDPPGAVQLAGIFLIIFGTLGIGLSAYALGLRRFAVWAVLKPESAPRLRVASGVFEWCPHPAYLGHIFIMLGCLALTGKFYIALVVAFQLVIMPIVIWLEEEELRKRTQ
ncbi:MAG: hypothetical protein HY401_04920 [Elusimicrobia bacterium]|nr:hypothetical protein [Elusimicrobiota bacterium]